MTFSWGVVHTVSPLTVIEDGSSNALPVIQSLVDPSSLTVGDMVRVELAQGGRVVVYGLPGGDPRVGINEGDIALLNSLPDPIIYSTGTANTVSASSWANLATRVKIDIVLDYDCWVDIEAGAWVVGADTRVSTNITGATTMGTTPGSSAGLQGWGQIIIMASSGTVRLSHFRTEKLLAGTTTIEIQAYRYGSNGNCNYPVLKVLPLRWA